MPRPYSGGTATMATGRDGTRWRASCDMRRERRPPWWLMYATVAVLSERTSTCFSCSSILKRRRASHTAINSRQLICHCSWGPVQSPTAACQLHMAPQPVAEASVETTTCLDTCSRAVVLKLFTPSTTSENIWLSKYHHYDQH